ncbi:MAG: hypothetical protein GYA02_05835 [Clostridiaceae bacterium]|nr:hypothetical protein [Clostridiaceae bacterium]
MKNAAWKQLYEKSNMEIMNLDKLNELDNLYKFDELGSVEQLIKQGKGNNWIFQILRGGKNGI